MLREYDIPREEKDLLRRIRSKPAAYLGDYPGLHELKMFIDGYEAAALQHYLHDVQMIPDAFQAFVEDYFCVRHDQPFHWSEIIQQHQPDDRAALGYFWEILNEYLSTHDCEEIPRPREVTEQRRHPDGIDLVKSQDLPRLAESYMRTFNGEPWWDKWDKASALARLQMLFQSPGFVCFAVWKDGVPLGAVMGRSEKYYDKMVFQIVELWVEPRIQGHGWGKRLLDELRHFLLTVGVNRLYLITMHGESTEGFYEKCGFTTQEAMCLMQLEQGVDRKK